MSVARVRRALGLQLPGIKFDDELVEYLAGALDQLEQDSSTLDVDMLNEAWSPFLISHSAAHDEESSREICHGLLERLNSEGSTTASEPGPLSVGDKIRQRKKQQAAEEAQLEQVPSPGAAKEEVCAGLAEWLETLRLSQYIDEASKWCEKMGAADVGEVKENWEDLATHLNLKVLEKKRLAKNVQGDGATPSSASTTTPKSTTPTKAPKASGGYSVQAGPRPQEAARSPVTPAVASQPKASHDNRPRFGTDGEFVILEELGTGATAVVYKCMRGNEEFAVKVINLEKLRLQRQFERLQASLNRETTILFALRHAKIVTLKDVWEDEGKKLYLVMDLIEGGELFDYIVAKGRMTEDEARYVFLQIVEGLKYIHSKNIIHRDLKPENILIDQKHSRPGLIEIKLSDFGHSKLVRDGYSTALTRVGTPQYWAPEVSDADMHGPQGYDERVDLWSLGVVLYVMLVGTYPFDGVSAPIEHQRRAANFQFWGSREAEQLVRGLIKVNPAERLTLDDCLNSRWVTTGASAAIPRIMKLHTEIGADRQTVEMKLPAPPDNVEGLRNDLTEYGRRFKASALLDHLKIIVTFRDRTPESVVEEARKEMTKIVEHYYGNQWPKQQPFRLHIHVLRVDAEAGAGIELDPEAQGMRVKYIEPFPGQPGLKVGDLIVKIQEQALCGGKDRVHNTFKAYFKDGAQLAIKRQKK